LHTATRHTTNKLTLLSGYRFGFNNQEKDNEVAGSGNSYTAEYWQYDNRLCRRWNVDPITYPWHSSYAVFNNCPIVFIDPLGLEPEGDPNKKESKTINAPLDEVVVRAKRPSWFKRMGVNFKNIVNPSDEYKAYKNAQKQETEANAKPKGEYKSYGWTREQNLAASQFILNVSLGTMTGGLGFVGGRFGSMGIDATSQYIANGFDYKTINLTSVGLSGLLPGNFGGHIAKNVSASAFNLNFQESQIIGLTDGLTPEKVIFNATVGFAFDRVGAHYEGLAKGSTSYISRMSSLSYKPKMALAYSKYQSGVLMSTGQSKIGLSTLGNILQIK
jgi:hypothetical protein